MADAILSAVALCLERLGDRLRIYMDRREAWVGTRCTSTIRLCCPVPCLVIAWKRKAARAMADRRDAAIYDLTRADYSFRPRDGGHSGAIACWNGRKPFAGDYLILRNGERSSRYRVLSVDLCMNVDPPTMWMAELAFDPRAATEPDQGGLKDG